MRKPDLFMAKLSMHQKRHLPKDQAKSNMANKFIGRGNGATGQYAEIWREAGMPVNCGNYEYMDIVFISANGRRPGRQDPDFVEIKKAIDAGCMFVTDAKSRRPEGGNGYNMGEQQVADFLRKHGYLETFVAAHEDVCLWIPKR